VQISSKRGEWIYSRNLGEKKVNYNYGRYDDLSGYEWRRDIGEWEYLNALELLRSSRPVPLLSNSSKFATPEESMNSEISDLAWEKETYSTSGKLLK
jgi:hypothetical protein